MLQIAPPATAEELQEYYEFRWQILRAPWNQPRGSERDALEATADHLAARTSDGRLVGIGRLHLNDATEAQIRYMAVAQDLRQRGIGRAIVLELEAVAKQRGAHQIVLNARDEVVGFYERLGFEVVGPGPTMFSTVTHCRMKKHCGPNT